MGSPLYRQARQAPQDDSASRALRSKVEQRLASVRALHETQAAIVLAMRAALKALEKIPGDMYSRKWFEQRQDAIRAEAQRALDDAETAAAEQLEAVREVASAAAKRPPAANSAEAMLLEAQVSNAWQSLRQILDSASKQADGLAAIEAAAASASSDAVKIEALRRFGDDWVAGTFQQEPRYARERILNALHAGTDAAEEPTLSPLQRTARDVLQDVERGTSRLQVGTNEARKEIAGRGQIAAALPGWDDNQTIPLTHKGMPLPVEAHSIVSAAFGPEAQAFMAAPKNYPLLSEQGALQGTVLDMSTNAQLYRRLGMNVTSQGEPGQE